VLDEKNELARLDRPRSLLRHQHPAGARRGFAAQGASELEFFAFKETFDSARGKHY